MLQLPVLLLVLLAALASPTRAGVPTGPGGCAAAAEFTDPGKGLAFLAEAIKGHDPIDILAVGSATTVGQDGGGGKAFPHRMIEALRAAMPGREIGLVIRGARGLLAADMLKMIDAELAEQKFTLVLWQTGTVEAVHGVAPDAMRATLIAGAEHIRAQGGGLILVDAQYGRYLRGKVDLAPFLQVMRDVAEMPGVALFRRYDLMRSWVQAGRNDLEHAKKTDREEAIDALHACLGTVLARFVGNAAGDR